MFQVYSLICPFFPQEAAPVPALVLLTLPTEATRVPPALTRAHVTYAGPALVLHPPQ